VEGGSKIMDGRSYPWYGFAALALVALVGCGSSAGGGGGPEPKVAGSGTSGADLTASVETSSATPTPVEVSFPEPPVTDDKGTLKKELWEAHSMRGTPVGYGYTSVREVEREGELLELTRHVSLLSVKREGQPVEQWIRLATWSTPEGEFRRFETEMTGGGAMKARGSVYEGKLTIQTATAGKVTTNELEWDGSWGGFDATERSLTSRPMQPGEQRTIRALLPIYHTVGETQLSAGAKEAVKLPSGEQMLLRIDSIIHVGGQKMQTVMWCDDRGDIRKSLIPGMEQEQVRVSREEALMGKRTSPIDLIVASIVPLKGGLPNPPATRRAVYRARVNQGTIGDVFDDCLSQRVNVVDEKTAELTVLAVQPDRPADAGAQEDPTEDDLGPNNLIQSDAASIVQLSREAASSENDAWRVAMALERFVHQAVAKKNFSQAFATAAEVAERREGDCTEHAVLLAALCRARGIPARVAFGLVYYPPHKGFAYHMWNEVWVSDRWIPLDATLGRGSVGADHIKLADSNLKGSTAYSAMLPVVQVFGRLELEVLEVE
jgi:hypothetical protein